MTRSTCSRGRVLSSTPVKAGAGAHNPMAKVTIRIPNVSWREGRPRFNPGPKQRKLGLKGQDLRHGENGPWYTIQEAATWAEEKAAEIAGRRVAKAAGRKPGLMRRAKHQTIEGLFDEWFASPKFNGGVNEGKRQQKGASDRTTKDYKSKVKTLAAHDAELMQEPPASITSEIAQGLFDDLWSKRGLHTARGIVAVASSCWKWAKARGRGGIQVNPWIGLEKPLPDARLVTWADFEVRAFAAAADLLGRPELGDSLYLGLFTGQRQGDRLLLERQGKDDAGRLVFKQGKTGAIVAVPAAPQLAARLATAERRRFSMVLVGRPEKGESQASADARARRQVIVDETGRRPFLGDWYRNLFSEVRAAAARGLVRDHQDGTLQLGPEDGEGVGEWVLEPCPSVAERRDQDLRDTAVTWLGRAGCTVPEIASITGHSFVSIHQVLRHYLATHPEMADDAINKLVSWIEKKGMVL